MSDGAGCGIRSREAMGRRSSVGTLARPRTPAPDSPEQRLRGQDAESSLASTIALVEVGARMARLAEREQSMHWSTARTALVKLIGINEGVTVLYGTTHALHAAIRKPQAQLSHQCPVSDIATSSAGAILPRSPSGGT